MLSNFLLCAPSQIFAIPLALLPQSLKGRFPFCGSLRSLILAARQHRGYVGYVGRQPQRTSAVISALIPI